MLDSYQKALDDKPIFTKACTSGVGFAVSDVLTQLFIEKMDFDLKRLVKMASFGFLLHGPTGHFFYQFLDGKLTGTAPLTVAAKVAIDQTCWAPVFMVMFFSYMMVFEGTPDLIEAKIRQDVFTAVKGSWMTWIPAHTINFAFVPSDMRLLYINTIQIFFNMFMSVIGNTEAVPRSLSRAPPKTNVAPFFIPTARGSAGGSRSMRAAKPAPRLKPRLQALRAAHASPALRRRRTQTQGLRRAATRFEQPEHGGQCRAVSIGDSWNRASALCATMRDA